jgi:hypothetical protein
MELRFSEGYYVEELVVELGSLMGYICLLKLLVEV